MLRLETFAGHPTFWSVFAVAVAAWSAALFAGMPFGSLFGLPKTLDRPGGKGHLATSTNLDQISDRPTKILVGLGLVQLGKLPHAVSAIGNSIAPGLGERSGASRSGSVTDLLSRRWFPRRVHLDADRPQHALSPGRKRPRACRGGRRQAPSAAASEAARARLGRP